MQIVWDKTAAEQMRSTHTLLELETFDVKGTSVTTYCVVPPEKIITDIINLETFKLRHQDFLDAYQTKNVNLCQTIAQELTGRFGGELDTFYEEIVKRLKTTT